MANNKKPEYFVGVEDSDGNIYGIWFFENFEKAKDFCDKVDDYSNKAQKELLFIGDGPEPVGEIASVDEALNELKETVDEYD